MKIKFIITIFALLFTSACTNTSVNHIGTKNNQEEKQETAQKEVQKPAPKTASIPVEKKPEIPDSKLLDVPILNQMTAPRLYNGCEVTSLAMLLNYRGIHVTKNQLANHIKRVPLTYGNGQKGNPNIGFVGNMENGPGLGVYHEPIAELAKKYAGNKVEDLTGKPFDEIIKKVGKGSPVWIITTVIFAPVNDFKQWETPQGPIKVTYKEHSVVITGYDSEYIYVNDPYGHKNSKWEKTNFIKAWEQMGKQAVTVVDKM